MLHDSLSALASFRQFIVYSLVPTDTPGKMDKYPCDWRNGKVVNAHNPDIWTTYETANLVALQWGPAYGVGFVFTDNDPFWFIDIDGAYNPASGTWSRLALQLLQVFAGCAFEISTSGSGGHIFGTGVAGPHSCKNVPLGIEFYTSGRFVALTGNGAAGNISAPVNPDALPWLVASYFPPGAAATKEQEWTGEPDADWNGPREDSELIRRAMASQSAAAAFAGKATFADLWLANEDALSRTYPDGSGRNAYDASQADMALAQHLAFWTGRDCERIERLMWESGLKREKWETRAGYYLPRTITLACARQEDVLRDPSAISPSGVSEGTPSVTDAPVRLPQATAAILRERDNTGTGFLGREQMAGWFTGCVYVSGQNRIFIPTGDLLRREQFRVLYGGKRFPMDHGNEKSSADAWEAFTENQVFACPIANGTCFKPDMSTGAIIVRNGRSEVNTYVPLNIHSEPGDITPYLRHIELLLPDERDRAILHSYLAFLVQHKGKKAQWAPVLQGTQGNGKTLISRVAAYMIGKPYTHWPTAAKLAEKFNSWLVGKMLYCVEDIFVADSRREIMEQLKPMITNKDGFEIEAKGFDQYSAELCGNFIFNMNNLDGILVTNEDRRYAIFYTAQQNVGDLHTSGMTEKYFAGLYDFMNESGYARVMHYYETYAIPDELNPALGAQRAPLTSSTSAAIKASAGTIEQEIEEYIAQGLQGFCGGWISSIWLGRLFEANRIRIGHNKRREVLERLGYVQHPSLPDGRTVGIVGPDNSKPRLYVRKDSLSLQITDPHLVAAAYEKAQRQASLGSMQKFG